MVKFFTSTNILLLYLDVTGAKTTSKTSTQTHKIKVLCHLVVAHTWPQFYA